MDTYLLNTNVTTMADGGKFFQKGARVNEALLPLSLLNALVDEGSAEIIEGPIPDGTEGDMLPDADRIQELMEAYTIAEMQEIGDDYEIDLSGLRNKTDIAAVLAEELPIEESEGSGEEDSEAEAKAEAEAVAEIDAANAGEDGEG